MHVRKSLSFLLQTVTVGLAAAFIIFFLRPDLLERNQTVVEFRESAPLEARLTAANAASGAPASYTNAVELAAPAVVNIHTEKVITRRPHPFFEDPTLRRFFGDESPGSPRPQLETSLGSGVIVSSQGYILTNNHVIDGADDITIALRSGQTATARVVGTDPETDLAVLKIDVESLPAIVLGHSEQVRVGDVVLAIGNPFGVGQTVTSGIVSATGRSRLGLSTFENFIQTDAAINPGNSGGALINTNGELLGINTAIFSRTGGSQGIGFAIPVSAAKDVLRQIIEHGRVIRGWLGIEIQDLTPMLAESFDLAEPHGVIIAGVLNGGPAERAGLRAGDIITTIDGQRVGSVADALDVITRATPGSTIGLEGHRDGKALRVESAVVERPAPR